MSSAPPEVQVRLHHHLRRLRGRDPHEPARVSSPLELLFDLSFAVAFGVAGDDLAGLVASGHVGPGLLGFAFASFAIVWAWINFTWFASAFDTDDWLFRLTTMVQMTGVIVLALGLPAMFASAEKGAGLDIRVMALGYVIMRVAMVFQWIRAFVDCPDRRPGISRYLWTLVSAQAGWVALGFAGLGLRPTLLAVAVLITIELLGPLLGERVTPTPWHAHHIAERYGLLAIIALGEAVLGTVSSFGAAIDERGWTLEAVLVVLSGVGITFALWWVYFGIPFAPLLHAHRGRSFGFGYLHLPLFASIAAVGAGLSVAGESISGRAGIGVPGVVASVALPVGVFIVSVPTIYSFMSRRIDVTQAVELLVGLLLLATAYLVALAGADLGWALLLVALSPTSIVVGYEIAGHRRVAELLDEVIAGRT